VVWPPSAPLADARLNPMGVQVSGTTLRVRTHADRSPGIAGRGGVCPLRTPSSTWFWLLLELVENAQREIWVRDFWTRLITTYGPPVGRAEDDEGRLACHFPSFRCEAVAVTGAFDDGAVHLPGIGVQNPMLLPAAIGDIQRFDAARKPLEAKSGAVALRRNFEMTFTASPQSGTAAPSPRTVQALGS
jgi:hypothetical protein